jgi:TRAP-type C4-dicarboxylate transport system substrate-binding protein
LRSPPWLLPLQLRFQSVAQTMLKFSHTDQQQGARQAAAQVFAKKVEEYTQGSLQGAGVLLQPVGQRP